MKQSKGVRKDTLKRLAREGKLLGQGVGGLDFCRPGNGQLVELPVRLFQGHGDFRDGVLNLREEDFEGPESKATVDRSGLITLIADRNNIYRLRSLEPVGK